MEIPKQCLRRQCGEKILLVSITRLPVQPEERHCGKLCYKLLLDKERTIIYAEEPR